jgi:hypothetical protein
MDVQPTQPSAKGPAEWFTGDVWIDAIARGAEPSRAEYRQQREARPRPTGTAG